MNGQAPSQEHSQIAVQIGTKIANDIAALLPEVQVAMATGQVVDDVLARLSFRPGGPGESSVVAELVVSRAGIAVDRWYLSPSRETGELSVVETPPQQVLGANGSQPPPQYQRQLPIPIPQYPQPLPERTPLPPPEVPPGTNLVPPPHYPPLVGPIAQMEQPMAQNQQQPQLTPKQYAEQYAEQNPQAAKRPGKLKRPPMAGDEGIS